MDVRKSAANHIGVGLPANRDVDRNIFNLKPFFASVWMRAPVPIRLVSKFIINL